MSIVNDQFSIFSRACKTCKTCLFLYTRLNKRIASKFKIFAYTIAACLIFKYAVMKNSLNESVLNGAVALNGVLGKFICRMSSLVSSSKPVSAELNENEWFTHHQALADYLHCSVRTVKIYKKRGDIPFIMVNGRSWSKKSDVERAIELNPSLNALFNAKARPLRDPMMTIRKIVKVNRNWSFLFVWFQGFRFQIYIPNSLLENELIVDDCIKSAVAYQHSIKPFRYTPDFITKILN